MTVSYKDSRDLFEKQHFTCFILEDALYCDNLGRPHLYTYI